jgi:serine/threonine-protein kinase RsbT
LLPRRHPSDIADARLLAVLGKYVPPIIARSIVERARREATSGPEVSWTDPNGLLDRISVGVRLFAAPEQVSTILREITNLAAEDLPKEEPPPPSRTFDDEPSPASTLKPARVRSLFDASAAKPRPPSDRSLLDDAPTHRDAPTTLGPPSSGGAPQSAPGSGPGPASRRDLPPPSAPASFRDPRDVLPPSRRDTDVAAFAWRTGDTLPPNRGVFSTSGPSRTTAIPTTPRSPGTRSASPVPAIPPPPISVRGVYQTPATGLPVITPPPPPPQEVTITLLNENDISRARQVAREICEALGTRALTQQRLVTIVSELGRNQVLYAGGGKITVRPPTGASRRVVVIAVDQGPGIVNLSEIMAGRYKSRSGLGLGIVGTKRLADSFHIDTGRHGTAISVEVIV